MKKMFIILAFFAGILNCKPIHAQVNVSVNIAYQPLWGPVDYDYVEYYYIPEADVYYYVPTAQFIYFSGGDWVYVSELPAVYHIDLYRTYKVVINEPKPYLHHDVYKVKYVKYKTYYSKQVVIRDSRDKKYYVVKGHPGAGGGAKVKESKPRGDNPRSSSPKVNSSRDNSKGSAPKGNSRGSSPRGKKGK